MAIHHNLALVTSSRHELIKLCHSEAIRSSPFFNIFANINLGLFTDNEALDLISQSLDGTNISFTEKEIDTIFRIAGHHPHFLQLACSSLFNAYARNLQPDERAIYLHSAFCEEAWPHLAFYWHTTGSPEKIVLIALTLLEGQKRSDNPHPTVSVQQLQDLYAYSSQALNRLEKRGLVTSNGSQISLFNVSFGKWIWDEITDTKRDQQSFKEWLTFNECVVERLKDLPGKTKKELSEILSNFNGEYRELILNWIIEPRILIIVGRLIKGFLGFG